MPMQPREQNATISQRIVLLAALLSAFALRLFHLGAESLWYDETVSVVLARQTLPALLAHTAGDIHPPGYYLLLHFWQWLAQPSLVHGLEFLYAWPSLVFGLLIVALLYPIGRTVADWQSAHLAVWLAALNPFQIWYSQEVRMYTLGGALGLLCLWAVFKYLQMTPQVAKQARRWLLLYALAGSAGLYTLYYFLFLLIALNLFVFWHCWQTRRINHQASSFNFQCRAWLLAQLGIVLLWLPWLPIFWRQTLDPPVPPWRTPWPDLSAFLHSLGETLSTLLVGQGSPDQSQWPWALLVVGVIVLYLYVNLSSTPATPKAKAQRLLLTYLFAPILLIDLLTLTVIPLYHVRYLFTYAPPFLLLLATVIQRIQRLRRGAGVVVLFAVIAVSGWRLQQFWFDPRLRTDDHRAAVAYVAAHWRPGDVILVNAGWIYTVLATYWPSELADPAGALPPPLATITRLSDYVDQSMQSKNQPANEPILVRTGSVDGSPDLGWGDPQSDFFALSQSASAAAMQHLAATYARIWHYRLYDTVNDPQGTLRAALAAQGTLVLDQPIPGRDYLRLQLYQSNPPPPNGALADAPVSQPLRFGTAVQLTDYQAPPSGVAGSILYVATRWQAEAGIQQIPAALNFSLRLYNEQGQLVAQNDQPPWPATTGWRPLTVYPINLALPIAVATRPGIYQLAVVVYVAGSGQPLTASDQPADQPYRVLARLPIAVASQAPAIDRVRATFDYIDLVTAQVQRTDNQLHVKLVWRPRPNGYTDTYLAALELRDATGNVVQRWVDAMGGWSYPSGGWPARIPVQEERQLDLPPSLPGGTYTVYLQVLRNSDQGVIPAVQGWWPLPANPLAIGEIIR